MKELDAGRWARQKELFHRALDEAPAARERFVREACADDPALAADVELMLAAHDETGAFLDTPLAPALARAPVPDDDLAASNDPLLGSLLEGKYQIEERLGRGGMGSVYRATHLGTGRPVAVKVIAPQYMAHPEFLERFRREARAAGRLRHPNVVNVTDFGFSGEGRAQRAYLVMEYLDGRTLREVLEERAPLPLELVVDVVEQTALAVDEAHRQGILHRDLKPDNIWLEPDGRGGFNVKVLDFGLAKLAGPDRPEGAPPRPESAIAVATRVHDAARDDFDSTLMGSNRDGLTASAPLPRPTPPQRGRAATARAARVDTPGEINARTIRHDLTRIGIILGTPAYMSPEQCRGERLDAAADVYSLGVLAYEMLAGAKPFEGDTRELLVKHGEMPPPPLASRRRGLPRRVAEVVMSALAKSRAERPPTAGAFAASLGMAMEGAGGVARRADEVYRRHRELFLRAAGWVFIPAVMVCMLLAVTAWKLSAILHAPPRPLGLAAWVAAALVLLVASAVYRAACAIVIKRSRLTSRHIDARELVAELRRRGRDVALAELRGLGRAVAGAMRLVKPGWQRLRATMLSAAATAAEGCDARGAVARSEVLAARVGGLAGWLAVREAVAVLSVVALVNLTTVAWALLWHRLQTSAADFEGPGLVIVGLSIGAIVASAPAFLFAKTAVASALVLERARRAAGEAVDRSDAMALELAERPRTRDRAPARAWAAATLVATAWAGWLVTADLALSHAVRSGSPVLARALIVAGADPNATLEKDSFLESQVYVFFKAPLGRTPLETALLWAENDRLETVRLLLEAGTDPNAAGKSGLRPLHAALMRGPAVRRLLLDAGADPNLNDRLGNTPLAQAAQSGDVGAVADFLARGADPNATDANGMIPLMGTSSVTAVRALLDAGASIHALDAGGATAFAWAVQRGRFHVARELVERGAESSLPISGPQADLALAALSNDVRTAERALAAGAEVDGQLLVIPEDHPAIRGWGKEPPVWTPLALAAGMGSADVVRFLLDHGAAPDARGANRPTPLIAAASSGETEIVRMLVARGADLRTAVRPYPSTNALASAVAGGHPDTVRVLLELGANPNEPVNETGAPPLVIALYWRSVFDSSELEPRIVDAVRVLLDHGADVNASNPYERTALVNASVAGMTQLVALLLERGASVGAKDYSGATALHHAAYSGTPDAVRILLAAGADPHARDMHGNTPADSARESGNAEVVALLTSGR